METNKKIYAFFLIITAVVILIYGQSIIIPFILAVLFWYIIRINKKFLLRIKVLQKFPDWSITTFSFIVLIIFLSAIITLITSNIQQLSSTLPVYQENIHKITTTLNKNFNTDIGSMLNNFAKNYKFAGIFTGVLSAITGIFGNAVTITLYLVFLLVEEKMFPKKMEAIYENHKEFKKIESVLDKIDKSIGSYIALKTIISIITGILSYIALLSIGIDAPAFWAFLIFILNFIPTIGSLVATIFPAIFALLQFGRFTEGFLVIFIVGFIQVIVGNFVEPKIMGNSLNISPLVVLLTLAIWGVMWGITGMLFSVPITVILIIIMNEFPSTRPIAILLSQNGNLNPDIKESIFDEK